ncbi:MAG: putative toxin-antitoxin system toxin component, PIN family [Acidobacteriia bacterium]|nr:putative toxin-antitoxin system toxin component, PIN family [Terriglobia bacterium]
MTRVVLDSNIYVSALLFGGNPRLVVELAEQSFIDVYCSPPIQKEVARVLHEKFLWSKEPTTKATNYLWSLARCVTPRTRVNDCPDPDDNRVLECALEVRAAYIVTGDQHLLSMHPYHGISILTARQFLEGQFPKS